MKNNIGNMFSTIKNGLLVKRPFVLIPKTKYCEQILNILWDEGFILGYTINNSENEIKILLKYIGKTPAINFISYVSKPSKRIFYSVKQIWKINSGQNFVIFSTSRGLKTILDCKKENIGGEPIVLIN